MGFLLFVGTCVFMCIQHSDDKIERKHIKKDLANIDSNIYAIFRFR